eukprot:CAMPEP_0201477418 /NCGR_PEP_ID=MMETSP0151_2-20130828/2435_1 /ASSEMBLY_ACC=CAM_ASM_000257 /TAXON_ID=200890 /ORGANISM="Paramoeba atlantica, Strain 621/1 / CCAP 1560/9" /LENGTH=254 /DNA_ID=CAMNT_0047858123 /DNA_START=142 /DNA_END=903 /DNA_ORIENTATION=+
MGSEVGLSGLYRLKKVSEWTSEDINCWLLDEGFDEYEIIFSFNRIDGGILTEMDEFDLPLLGIDPRHFRRFEQLIQEAKAERIWTEDEFTPRETPKRKKREVLPISPKKSQLPPDPSTWGLREVAVWLTNENLGWAKKWFVQNEIDGESLVELGEKELLLINSTAEQYFSLAHKIADLRLDVGAKEVKVKLGVDTLFVVLSKYDTISSLEAKVGNEFSVVFEDCDGDAIVVKNEASLEVLIQYVLVEGGDLPIW